MGNLKDVLEILKPKRDTETVIEPDHILCDIFQDRIDNALEKTLRNDKRYKKISDQIGLKTAKIDEIGLNHQQWRIVDNTISAYTERGAEYGRVAYFQGFKDALKLLTELAEMI